MAGSDGLMSFNKKLVSVVAVATGGGCESHECIVSTCVVSLGYMFVYCDCIHEKNGL